ncbi:MAG: S8 family serine peptidase [Acidobacteriota bacterium]|nr:S8 family serine peptidase [Acidobacteriota bacterium]
MRLLRALAVLGAGVTVIFAQGPSEYVPGQIIVQKRLGASQNALDKAFRGNNGRVTRVISGTGHFVLQIPDSQVDRVMQNLERTGLFTVVERDGVAHSTTIPNDPSFASQWYLSTIQAPTAWNTTTGTAGAPIAIIDSGADSTHPDLGARLMAGWSFLLGNSNTSDTQGHGTAVSGTVGAIANNLTGIAGVTWQNPIMPLVVVDSTGSASYSNIASAIEYAADHGARVMNISLAGTTSSSTVQSAVDYAWNKGAVVFAAAGNNGNSTPVYPAACNHAVSVSATNPDDSFASFSDYGTWIDLSSPGNNILTTTNGGGYAYWYGTSFASPIATGVAALALGANPALSASGLVTLLEANSDDLGAAGYDPYYGWGRVNAAKAVAAAKAGAGSAPLVSIATPGSGSSVTGTVTVTGSASGTASIAQVNLFCDGVLAGSTTAANYAISWNTATVAAGSHTLQVQAIDSLGNAASASEAVTVLAAALPADTTPPTVQIMNPASGATVSGLVTISVSATDNVAVAQVCIYVDGVQVYSGTAAPYATKWNTKKVKPGTHTITAKAWDTSGNSASATPVSVVK